MATFYVIKTDDLFSKMISGCYVSQNRECFRKVPITSVIWTEKVEAETAGKAVDIAIAKRKDRV